MARFKHIDTSPQFVAIDLQAQLIPGTFAFALNYLVEEELDLSALHSAYCNDDNGAPAYPPSMLLKVILLGYAHGLVSSRAIATACREHVLFMAMCGLEAPHFTTIAAFVRHLGTEITTLFARIVSICDREGLIGRELFAIDGVKLPGNASKEKSGTRADLLKQHQKLEKALAQVVTHHAQADLHAPEAPTRAQQQRQKLQQRAAQLKHWLDAHPEDKKGSKNRILKSNVTDNDSAKMATSKGVIQGYCGIATVDARHQIILDAHAQGHGSEQAALLPTIQNVQHWITPTTLITADSGYHSDHNITALEAQGINALIADRDMRQRDERFATQDRHRQKDPLHNKEKPPLKKQLFTVSDFVLTDEGRGLICPAGKRLYSSGSNIQNKGKKGHAFCGTQRDCQPCTLRNQCLRTPDKTPFRQVTLFGEKDPSYRTASDRMRERIDSEEGRRQYSRRLGTVEPVFANIRHNKKLSRFTLRGHQKVNTQWQLFCLVHNIEKLAHNGYRNAA